MIGQPCCRSEGVWPLYRDSGGGTSRSDVSSELRPRTPGRSSTFTGFRGKLSVTAVPHCNPDPCRPITDHLSPSQTRQPDYFPASPPCSSPSSTSSTPRSAWGAEARSHPAAAPLAWSAASADRGSDRYRNRAANVAARQHSILDASLSRPAENARVGPPRSGPPDRPASCTPRPTSSYTSSSTVAGMPWHDRWES